MAEKYFRTEYPDPDKLSTEALEELIRADFVSDDLDEDYIMRALEVIERRERSDSSADRMDVDAAWEDFRRIYCTDEGRGKSLYESRAPQDTAVGPQRSGNGRTARRTIRFTFKRVGLVAALMALFLAGMVSVQAAGIDIFGAIAHWTDEMFQFTAAQPSAVPDWNMNLASVGVDSDLLPTWIPEGFEAGELEVDDLITFKFAQQPFTSADGRYFDVIIMTYASAEDIPYTWFEKDSNPVEEYVSGGRTYYLFSNNAAKTGACLDGLVQISISGHLSSKELKQIIDSIGGTT